MTASRLPRYRCQPRKSFLTRRVELGRDWLLRIDETDLEELHIAIGAVAADVLTATLIANPVGARANMIRLELDARAAL